MPSLRLDPSVSEDAATSPFEWGGENGRQTIRRGSLVAWRYFIV